MPITTPILSACAVRASVALVALLYSSLTGNNMMLSEEQIAKVCPIGGTNDTISCALTTMSAKGIATAYHYGQGLANPTVGVRAVQPICLPSVRADTIACLHDWIGTNGPAIAAHICGVITAVINNEADNNTALTVRDLAGVAQTLTIFGHDADFYEALGSELWSAQVFDDVVEGSTAVVEGLSATTKFLIAQVALIAIAIIGVTAKWITQYGKCPAAITTVAAAVSSIIPAKRTTAMAAATATTPMVPATPLYLA